MYAKEVAPDRRTLRTVLRDTFSARTISLIDLPRTKCSRLIRPIVSTTSIPRHPLASPSGSACTSLRKGGQSWTPITPLPGSIFHAETQPVDTLGVDRGQTVGSPLALEERGDPPVPVGRPCVDKPTDRGCHFKIAVTGLRS